MRALIVDRIGQKPRLGNLDLQPPGPGEVRVRIEAAGLNFADLLMIEGRYQATPEPPFVLGLELCGTIEAVGTGVDTFAPGDRVAAEVAGGALAEAANVPAARCWRPPDGMPTPVAAGFQVAYGTSHLALARRGRLAPDETLLILGAAGGVGRTAVEIGHAMGARVIAVARGEERLAAARAAGADVTLDSATLDDLREAVKALGGADVVYDAVGGALGEAAFRALRPEGRHLLIGFASGDVPVLKLNHALVKNVDLIGVYWGGYAAFAPEAMTDSLSTLAEWYLDGRIAPHIDDVVPLDAALDALERLRRREVTGKIVVAPHSAP